MKKLIKLISINPTAETVEEVEINANNLQALYQHIGCHTIDFVCRTGKGDALIVDDEALLHEVQPPAFTFGYYPYRIHGIALVAGSDAEGNTTEPKLTLQQVRNLVKFIGNVRTEPIVNVISWE